MEEGSPEAAAAAEVAAGTAPAAVAAAVDAHHAHHSHLRRPRSHLDSPKQATADTPFTGGPATSARRQNIVRTIEHDVTVIMQSCIELYISLIDSVVPGSNKLRRETYRRIHWAAVTPPLAS